MFEVFQKGLIADGIPTRRAESAPRAPPWTLMARLFGQAINKIRHLHTPPLLEEELKLVARGLLSKVPADTVVHSFSIRSDKPPHFILTKHLNMIFVDLSLFSMPEGGFKKRVDMMTAWCYFIKWSSCLTEEGREALFKQSEVFKMAEEALKDLSVDSSVRVLEKLRGKWVSDQVTYFEYATQKGRKEGMQAVALNMLKEKADINFICKVTGLSEEEIKKLKNDSN